VHSEAEGFVSHYSSESAATQAVDTVGGNPEMSTEPWLCLDSKDGTPTNAGISDIYGRQRIPDTVLASQHATPWYPYHQLDAFGARNVAFGKTENPIHPMVKTEPKSEPVDQRIESDDSIGGRWPAEQFCSPVKGSEGACSEFDARPLRAIASVAPTQFTPPSASELPIDNRGLASDPTISHFPPPPLVPLQSSPVTPGLPPFGGHMLNAGSLDGRNLRPESPRESRSPVGVDYVTESEPEPDDGHCSPPPERINQEDHRSRNAM